MTAADWRDQAECTAWVDVFDQTFDTVRRARTGPVALASQVCGSCAVRQACLDDALDQETPGTRYGIRGGLLPAERSRLAHRAA